MQYNSRTIGHHHINGLYKVSAVHIAQPAATYVCTYLSYLIATVERYTTVFTIGIFDLETTVLPPLSPPSQSLPQSVPPPYPPFKQLHTLDEPSVPLTSVRPQQQRRSI